MTNSSTTATVEALTAEVRVLMVGSRQITLSVYGQLDDIPYHAITPMGRVAPKDGRSGWVYVVGKDTSTGSLARSSLPYTLTAIKAWVASNSRAEYWREQAAKADRRSLDCERYAAKCETDAETLLHGSQVYSVEVGNDRISTVMSALENVSQYEREAEAASAAADEAADEVARLKARADEGGARWRAAASAARAEQARKVAQRLIKDAQEWRAEAQSCREKSYRAARQADTCTDNDGLESERVTDASAKWSDLPLIVLAGLR